MQENLFLFTIYEIPNATISIQRLNWDICVNCVNRVVYYPKGLRGMSHATAIIAWMSPAGTIGSLSRQSVVLLSLPESPGRHEKSAVWVGTWAWMSLEPRAPPQWKRDGWVPRSTISEGRIWTPVRCPVSEVTVTAASSLIRLARHSLVLSCKRLDFASPGSSSWDRRENSL